MKVKCEYCGKMVHEQGLKEHQGSKKCWREQHLHLLDSPGSKMTITCLCGCGKKREIRKADFKRGWGMFFSKSCKAKYQEKDTGQYRAFKNGEGVSHAAKRRGEVPTYSEIQTVDGIEVGDDYIGLTDQEHDYACASAEMGWDAHKSY